MAASMTHPVYTANLIKADKGTKYRLKGVMTGLDISYQKNELAGKVTITLVNVKEGTKRLGSLFSLKDKMYVYANTGSGAKEVFRGFVWEKQLSTDAGRNELQLVCYDRMIYLQKCKDNLFVKKGKKTKDILTSLAKKWGFKISFRYKSISHKKLMYHNMTIADMFVSILDEVKKKTGTKYVVYMEKNVIVIDSYGSNQTIYHIEKKDNAIQTAYRQSMDDMVTKVLIVKAETVKKKDGESESGKYLTVSGVVTNTDKYGTMQEILVKDKDDKLSEVKKEANEILKEKSKPTTDIEIQAIDNPLIKKGHKVYINAGNLNNYYIVEGIDHDSESHTMNLEVVKA